MTDRMEVIKVNGRHFICMEDVIADVQELRGLKPTPTDAESFCMDRVERWMDSLIHHYETQNQKLGTE